MADDYLGKQMEDYRSGRLGKRPQRLSPTGQRPGWLTVRYPQRRVLVTDGLSPLGAQVVRALVGAGCRVAFCGEDARRGQQMAQQCGAQYRPESPAEALGKLPDIDVLVTDREMAVPESVPTVICLNIDPIVPRAVSVIAPDDAAIGPVAVFLCSPSGPTLRGPIILNSKP